MTTFKATKLLICLVFNGLFQEVFQLAVTIQNDACPGFSVGTSHRPEGGHFSVVSVLGLRGTYCSGKMVRNAI